MKIILVARANDKRVVCWQNVALLCIALAAVLGAGMAIVYWLLSGVWTVIVPMLGIMFALVVVGCGIVGGLQAPLDRLGEAR